jgi:hypothetical protein
MSNKKTTKCGEIINRLKVGLSLKSDKNLSDFLGIKPTTLSSWRTRDTLDYDLIFTKCVEISIDWLVTGKGPIRLDPTLKKPCDASDSNALYNEETEGSVDYWKERCLNLHEENSVLRGENERLRKKAGEPEIEVVKRHKQGG